MISVRNLFALFLVSLLAGCYFVFDDDSGWTDSYGHSDYYGDAPWIDTSASGWYCEDYYEHGSWHHYWELYAMAGDPNGISDIVSVEAYAYDYYGNEVWWVNFYGYPSEWYYGNNNGALEGEFTFTDETSLPCDEWHDIEFVVEDHDGNMVGYWIY